MTEAWVIVTDDTDHAGVDYWNNEDGWTEHVSAATVFTTKQRNKPQYFPSVSPDKSVWWSQIEAPIVTQK